MLWVDHDDDEYLRAGQQFIGLIRAGDWKEFTETTYCRKHPPLVKVFFGIGILPVPKQPLITDRSTTASPAQSLPQDQPNNARLASGALETLESTLLTLVNPLHTVHLLRMDYSWQNNNGLSSLEADQCILFNDKSLIKLNSSEIWIELKRLLCAGHYTIS